MTQVRDFESLARDIRGAAPMRNSALLALIIAFFVCAGVWATLTEIDDVTRADGRIVPSQQVQVIQAAEPGVLDALHVAEGDVVEAGQLLMELDRTMLSSQLDQEQQRAVALMAQIARLEAEIADRQPLFPASLRAAGAEIIASELALFEARQQELASDIQVLESQRIQRQQDYEEGQVDLGTAIETLALIDEEVAMMAPLVASKIEPETTMLALRRSQAEWRGREVRARAARLRLEASLHEIDDRIAAARARLRAATQADLARATADLAELETRLPALEERVLRAELRAPVRGIVNRMMLTTIGGVAQAGSPLLEIVPLDDSLLVEAYVRPADIAFLYPGQKVKVKITAYDFARYGGLEGEIARIGADAVRRPDREEQAFVVQVRTQSNLLDADGLAVEIVPGMIAEVDILAGRKTVMDYLTRPVVRVKERAFRE